MLPSHQITVFSFQLCLEQVPNWESEHIASILVLRHPNVAGGAGRGGRFEPPLSPNGALRGRAPYKHF